MSQGKAFHHEQKGGRASQTRFSGLPARVWAPVSVVTSLSRHVLSSERYFAILTAGVRSGVGLGGGAGQGAGRGPGRRMKRKEGWGAPSILLEKDMDWGVNSYPTPTVAVEAEIRKVLSTLWCTLRAIDRTLSHGALARAFYSFPSEMRKSLGS